MPNIHWFKKKFTGRRSSKHFLIRLLKIPPHLKYVTTVPCNLSLITALVCVCRSFSDVTVSQGDALCGVVIVVGSLINTLLQIYCRTWQWKKIENWLRINRVTTRSLVFLFFEHGVYSLTHMPPSRPRYRLITALNVATMHRRELGNRSHKLWDCWRPTIRTDRTFGVPNVGMQTDASKCRFLSFQYELSSKKIRGGVTLKSSTPCHDGMCPHALAGNR